MKIVKPDKQYYCHGCKKREFEFKHFESRWDNEFMGYRNLAHGKCKCGWKGEFQAINKSKAYETTSRF